MKFLKTIFLPTALVALCLLSLTPAAFASTTGLANMSVVSNALPATPSTSSAKFPVYDVTLSAKPKMFSINEAPGSSCMGYPVCGSGTTNITLDNKGSATFTTTGGCQWVVKPAPNGKKSEKLGCSVPKGFALPAGSTATLTWTTNLYNWPAGSYKFTLFIDGKVGTTKYSSKTGSYTVSVTVS
jgi:hypothetical protein